MNRMILYGIAFCQTLLMWACTTKPSNSNKVDNDSHEIAREVIEEGMKGEVFEKVEITSKAILNKTFYHIQQTDSGEVVVNWFQKGLDGVRYTDVKVEAFGSEEYVLDIDSINIQSDTLFMFLSSEYTNLFGDKEKDCHVDKIELICGKDGCILVNGVGILIDSIYAGKTIPIVKEEPYDIREAIGDF